jgi:formylglycine-generating enzyme required for sulfatase activity
MMKPEWFAAGYPLHRVCITRPFYIGKYEVTQAQWRSVTGTNPSRFANRTNSDLRPVESVTHLLQFQA